MSQSLSLKEQIKVLEHLQELDLKIDQIRKKKATFPAALRTLEESRNKARGAVEARKSSIAEIEKIQRQTQAAMDLNKDRLTRANSKLESVQNSQEFQAASKEIEQLRKLNLSLEEQIKKSNQELEAGNQDLNNLDSQFQKSEEEWTSQSQQVAGESQKLDAEIAALVESRSPYTSQVEKRILAQYDRIRVARGGLGLVPAVGGRCSGCNIMLPPQLFNEVQRASSLHLCPSCHRILFVPVRGEGNDSGNSRQQSDSGQATGSGSAE